MATTVVPRRNWVRCCHRSLAPWARYGAPTSHGVALTAAVDAMKNATTTAHSLSITLVRPSATANTM